MSKLSERLAEIRAEAQKIQDTADEAGRPKTADEQTQFDALISEAEQVKAAIDGQRAAREFLDALEHEDPSAAPAMSAAVSGRDFGAVFAESAEIRQLRAQYPSGIPAKTRVTTGAVRVGPVNTLLTDPSITPNRSVIDAPTGVAVMDLMQAITVIDGVMERSVDHHTATFTNVAAEVAEGAAKPEATLEWTSTTLTQEAVAQHIPVTNQAFKFNSMLRGIVNSFLVNGVRAKVQEQVATQLAAWAGLNTQAFDTDLRTTLRRAITKAQTAGAIIGAGSPSILISATDAETLDLEQLDNLVLAPGQAPNQATGIWRTPLVVSANLAAGFAYVGDLRQIRWYTTGDVEVSVGLVGNQFIENEQTILAETHGVTGVVGAAAIVKADLTAV